jgi:hypothetical protein
MNASALTLAKILAFDPNGGRGPERGKRYLCPLCHGGRRADAAHRSLSLDVARGLWNCKRCGATGKIRDENERFTGREVRAFRRQRAIATVTGRPSRRELRAVGDEEPRHLDDAMAALAGVQPIARTPGEAYLRRRGLAIDAGDLRGIAGFASSWQGRGAAVIFVLRDREGRVVAAQGRFLDPRDGAPKALSVGPISRGVFATAGALASEVLAIVEAPIDALSLAQLELPAIALCGSAIGTERATMLRRLAAKRQVLLATDADDAGDRCAAELRRQLTIATRCVRLEIPAPHKDVNEWLLADRPALAACVRQFLEPEPLVPIADVLADDELLAYAHEREQL